MKVVLAIDSFKGSMSSTEAAKAAARGVLSAYPCAENVIIPIADGGEGTAEAIVSARGGEWCECTVIGPIGEPVCARYGYMAESKTAVMEMSAAAGLPLVPEDKRNPMYTTTYGVGEMIRDAIARGARSFIIGIGGSATNDGGAGMLAALGFGLKKENGEPIALGALGLAELSGIELSDAIPELSECEFRVACDVKNPLCGKNGASYVYGGQKGADENMKAELDALLDKFATATESVIPTADRCAEGAGAAGGLGFALLSYLGAKLESGISLVIEASGLEEHIKSADVVVTGEGRIDGQSYMGKAPVGVASLAKKHGKLCVALAGSVAEDADGLSEHGIDAVFSILSSPTSLSEAMKPEVAKRNMENTARRVFSLIKKSR